MKIPLLITLVLVPLIAAAQEQELPDVTADLKKLIIEGGGNLDLPPGRHRITAPLEFDLAKYGAVKICASKGGATLVMDGAGPAIRLVGTHEGTASPKTFKPETWLQRMPIVEGIEIAGTHPEADGIELIGCMEPTIRGVVVRHCRHGIHLVKRNRNVIITDCHLYENSGNGVYFDRVNLHQANITSSHISYNRQGGIVIRDGNVRNVHITGCDIEGNMPGTVDAPTTAANVLIDVSATPDDKTHSIAEIAITGCTIQHSANYGNSEKTVAEGGANIRLLGKDIWPIDSVTISGNVISDTTTNIDIDRSTDVAISGNTFFAPKPDNLHVSNSKRIVVSGNTFNPRQFERPGRLVFRDSSDCIVSSNTLRGFKAEDGALQLQRCDGFILDSLLLTDCASGIVLTDSTDIVVGDCLYRGLPEDIEPVVNKKTGKSK